ncbi:MAG: hypothetical protein H6727_20105 [Myxococcales bacterium]|nr:hypothetical protein [Myxococcales bacterium]
MDSLRTSLSLRDAAGQTIPTNLLIHQTAVPGSFLFVLKPKEALSPSTRYSVFSPIKTVPCAGRGSSLCFESTDVFPVMSFTTGDSEDHSPPSWQGPPGNIQLATGKQTITENSCFSEAEIATHQLPFPSAQDDFTQVVRYDLHTISSTSVISENSTMMLFGMQALPLVEVCRQNTENNLHSFFTGMLYGDLRGYVRSDFILYAVDLAGNRSAMLGPFSPPNTCQAPQEPTMEENAPKESLDVEPKASEKPAEEAIEKVADDAGTSQVDEKGPEQDGKGAEQDGKEGSPLSPDANSPKMGCQSLSFERGDFFFAFLIFLGFLFVRKRTVLSAC